GDLEADTAASSSSDQKEVVFEDFESGYDGWKVKGKAFGKRPARGTLPRQQKVSGFVGRGLVNSYVGGDNSTGTMTSKPFTVRHRYIHLRVGGGNHKGRTCVNLRVDGRTVQSATGRADETLFPVTWDVSALKGKKATIQIVDNQRGGWGHINVDQIVFSDHKKASAVAASVKPPVSAAVLKAVAQKHQLDTATLGRWVVALADPKIRQDPTHPIHVWSVLAAAPDAPAFAQAKDELLKKPAAPRREPLPFRRDDARLLGDFDNGKLDGWFITGEAFKQSPTTLEWDPTTGGLTDPDTLHGGLYGRNLQGVLRSPTFTLNRKVHLRIKAENVQVRLIIEGYQMQPFNGLLFNGTNIKKLNTKGRYKWISMTSGLHLGTKAYVEIIDHGNGYAVLDQAWVDGYAKENSASRSSADRPDGNAPNLIPAASFDSINALAESLGRAWEEATGRWSKRRATGADRRLIAWAIGNNLIAVGSETLGPIRKQMQQIDGRVPKPRYVFAMTEGTP
ncbi:MAG: hypothetical protein R3236_12005, partial [Phycisphaeraceae bacterium]|nr:hypothetical protein [Phycisphaeraceae bacterium]